MFLWLLYALNASSQKNFNQNVILSCSIPLITSVSFIDLRGFTAGKMKGKNSILGGNEPPLHLIRKKWAGLLHDGAT